MKVNTKLRMLPLNSYLKKIGRYDPKLHKEGNSPEYPSLTMQELQRVAEKGEEIRFIRNWKPSESVKQLYKHKKFITVRVELTKNHWTIPSNWVVRV